VKQLQGSGLLVAGAAVVLVAAQPVWAQAARVTAVRLNPTNSGFNVVLETAPGARPQVFTSKRGNTLVADIINAQLRLPQGNNFRQEKPAPGIDSVVITQLDPNSVRMVITGTTSAPSSQIAQRNGQGITLSISPASGTPSAASAPAKTPAVGAASPQPGQTPTQKPNVLVPNPKVTIDGGAPPPSGMAQAENQAPPFLPRAVAPPVGDIAVSNADSSPMLIDLGTTERVPRLVLRDAPVREVLSLLARAANLNVAFTTATPPGAQQQQAQPAQPGAAADEGPRISLDIQDESVQDVFNYVLRISGLQANREGRTIFVGTRLPNEARALTVRSLRLNQVEVGTALNFLVAMGAESAVSRERTVTSVQAVPVGGAAAPATQTQTSTETRIETQRIDFQDSIPLLRGLQVVGDERTNSITLIGSSKQIDIATAQLVQLDSRRRQVAVNVKIVDVNLLATEDFNTSFSFGIGDSFFSNDGGAATVNFGRVNPPASGDVRGNLLSPPVIPNPITGEPFSDRNSQINVPLTNPDPGGRFLRPIPPFGERGRSDPLTPGISDYTPFTVDQTTGQVTPGDATFSLPTLFQFPSRFLSRLQAQVTSGNAKILTDPTLTVQEGQTAQVNLTSEVFGGTETTFVAANAGGNPVPSTRPIIKQAGLTVLIQIQRIDDNGFVTLSVAPTVSAPAGSTPTPLGTITLLSSRSLTSGQIRLRDGQTLILSGIIQDSDRTTVSKVPILGDIPILGALFRSTSRANQRQEVIVLLTPQIIDDSERSSSLGANYTPGPDARQMLERNRGLQTPSNNR
jgi:type IV pilus assembly protein PilQ